MTDHLDYAEQQVDQKLEQLQQIKRQIEETRAKQTLAKSDDLRYPHADAIYE